MTIRPDEQTTEVGTAVWRKALRQTLVQTRASLPDKVRAEITASLEQHLASLLAQLSPVSLAFCWPFNGEPDLRNLITQWLSGAEGRIAALPVVLERNSPLLFRRWVPGMVLVRDSCGIPCPPPGDELVPDAVLVPLNAFDAHGYRLGYGGGYFDRTLAAMPVTAVGVGFELGRVNNIHPQAHDRAMDWIVTEDGMFPARL